MKNVNTSDAVQASASSDVAIIKPSSSILEEFMPGGIYYVQHKRVFAERIEEYTILRDRLNEIKAEAKKGYVERVALYLRLGCKSYEEEMFNIQQEMAEMEYVLEEFEAHNLVVTVGKNFLLDNGLAGSAYTAAFFLGLISSVSFTAIAAADTMASHAGWTEAGLANAPIYSQTSRPAAAWSAASAGSKAFSAALTYSITTAGTVKGCFLTTVSTKDGTLGTLYSAGLFTGGDRVVANLDTLNVSYTASA